MTASPKVSVIVPVYKVEDYISRCIKSLQSQSIKDIEFIFIDDCGGDKSILIVEQFAASDNRIKIIYNDENIGAGKSRNKGIEAAIGEYIGFVDSDDWLDGNFYEVLYDTAKKGKYDIVKGRRVVVRSRNDGSNIHRESAVNRRIKDGLRKQTPLYCLFTAEHQSAIYRREMIHKFNIRNGTSSHSENGVFLLAATFHSKRFCIDGRVAYYYFQREDSSAHVYDYKMLTGELESFKQQMSFINQIPNDNHGIVLFLKKKIRFLLRRYDSFKHVKELHKFRKLFISSISNEIRNIPEAVELRKRGFYLRLLIDGKVRTLIIIRHFYEQILFVESFIRIKYKNVSMAYKRTMTKFKKKIVPHNTDEDISSYFDFNGKELIYLQNNRGCIIFTKKFLEINKQFAKDYLSAFQRKNAEFTTELSVDSDLYKEHIGFMENNEVCWRYSRRFGFISKTTLSLDQDNSLWFSGKILGDCNIVETNHFFVYPQVTRKLIDGIPLSKFLASQNRHLDDELRQYVDFVFDTFKTENPDYLQGMAYDAFPFNCILSEGHKYNLFDLEFEYKGNLPKGYILYKIVRGIPRRKHRNAYFKLCERYGIVPMWEYWDDFDTRMWVDTLSMVDEKPNELYNKYFI